MHHFEPVPNVKKIAVLRANAIGDFVFALPAFEALRSAFPHAEIVLLGRPWHCEFLEGRPGPIDRVIPVPPVYGIHGDAENGSIPFDSTEVREFLEQMAEEKFDIAIQLHGGGRHSNPFVSRLGARVTAGLRTPDAEPLDRWLPYYYYQSEVMRALEVVSLVGARSVTFEPALAVTAHDVAESEEVVPPTDAPLVLIHPGAGDGRRRWPGEKFAQVGDRLAGMGVRVLVSGTAIEQDLVDAVVGNMREPAQDICGRLSLGGLAGLFSRCALVISNDSGPLHMAMAVGAPTVSIYWVGNLITAGPATRGLNRPVISWRLTCPVCGNNCTVHECEHHESFVADIPVERVTSHALDLLSQPWRTADTLDLRSAGASEP